MPCSKINKILFQIGKLGLKEQNNPKIELTHKKDELKLRIEIM